MTTFFISQHSTRAQRGESKHRMEKITTGAAYSPEQWNAIPCPDGVGYDECIAKMILPISASNSVGLFMVLGG